MQRSETGFAEAFNLAAEQLKGKGKESNSLKRRINSLKKKTALSGKKLSVDGNRESSKKLWKRAKEGDMDDKAAYIEKRCLAVWDFKQGELSWQAYNNIPIPQKRVEVLETEKI